MAVHELVRQGPNGQVWSGQDENHPRRARTSRLRLVSEGESNCNALPTDHEVGRFVKERSALDPRKERIIPPLARGHLVGLDMEAPDPIASVFIMRWRHDPLTGREKLFVASSAPLDIS
jgi:hypothetical protein